MIARASAPVAGPTPRRGLARPVATRSWTAVQVHGARARPRASDGHGGSCAAPGAASRSRRRGGERDDAGDALDPARPDRVDERPGHRHPDPENGEVRAHDQREHAAADGSPVRRAGRAASCRRSRSRSRCRRRTTKSDATQTFGRDARRDIRRPPSARSRARSSTASSPPLEPGGREQGPDDGAEAVGREDQAEAEVAGVERDLREERPRPRSRTRS